MIYQPIENTGEYTTGTVYSEEYVKRLEQEIERLYKELKIKTNFIAELLYLILNSTDNKLQKEVHKIGVKYDKNIQKLKGSDKE